jgi:predicted GTPase
MSIVVNVKLINGDDLIATLVHEDEIGYIFEEPMVIEERVNSATGASVLVLVKYVHTNDLGTIELRKDHVIVVTPVQTVFEKYYHVSKIYSAKYVEPNVLSEIEKVTSAMEDVLLSPEKVTSSKSQLKSTSNNTIH